MDKFQKHDMPIMITEIMQAVDGTGEASITLEIETTIDGVHYSAVKEIPVRFALTQTILDFRDTFRQKIIMGGEPKEDE